MKKIVLALTFVLVGSFMLAGCSKDEILNHYNNIVQSAGSIELTASIKLPTRTNVNAKTIFFIKSSPAFLWSYLFGLFLCLGCFSFFHAQNQDGRNNDSKRKTARTGSDIPVDCGIIATVAYHSETCGNRIKVC